MPTASWAFFAPGLRVCRSITSAVTCAGLPAGEVSQRASSGRISALLPMVQVSGPLSQPARSVTEVVCGVQANDSSSWPRSPGLGQRRLDQVLSSDGTRVTPVVTTPSSMLTS